MTDHEMTPSAEDWAMEAALRAAKQELRWSAPSTFACRTAIHYARAAVLRFIDGLTDGEIRNTIGKAFGSTLPTGLLHLNGDAFRAALRKLAEER